MLRSVRPSVRSPKLAHLIAQRLREQIAEAQIGAGDTLPRESELLTAFGVSRPTLREALRVLESEGLIAPGRGRHTGAAVLRPSIHRIAERCTLHLAVEGATLGELHQVRMLLEPAIAASLARHPTRGFIKELHRCSEEQTRALQRADIAALLAATGEYHRVLRRFSGNLAIDLLWGILDDASAPLYARAWLDADQGRQRSYLNACQASVTAYRRLVKLIAAGRPTAAERFWRSYLKNVAARLSDLGIASLPVRSVYSTTQRENIIRRSTLSRRT